jgi:hypothetical protein
MANHGDRPPESQECLLELGVRFQEISMQRQAGKQQSPALLYFLRNTARHFSRKVVATDDLEYTGHSDLFSWDERR